MQEDTPSSPVTTAMPPAVAGTPAPVATTAKPFPADSQNWLIDPEKRIAVIALYLIAQLVIPYVTSLVNAAIVGGSASRATLGLVVSVTSLVSWLVLSGVQSFVLRKYLPAGSWFGMTVAGVFAALVVDAFLASIVLVQFGFSAYRVASPICRWILISSSQWLVLRSRVRQAEFWIMASVGAAFGAAFLLSAAIDAGPRAILVLPWIGLSVGAAQSWCLVQFKRR
jgi:hypothetical protein